MGESLTRLLDELEQGNELQDSEIGAFSDLDREEAARLLDRWPVIPLNTRALLIERAAELADANVELNFEALGKIGLGDPEPEVRERAVASLWESDSTEVCDRLSSIATEDTAPAVRAAAALGLARFVEAHVMDRLASASASRMTAALRTAVDDEDLGVRAAAVEASGALREDWVARHILDAYESEDRDLRIAAIRAMGYAADERWSEYISDQLFSGDADLRFEAILAAGNSGDESLVDTLGDLLNDDDPEVVLAAITALGEIGGEAAEDILREYLPEAPEGLEEAVGLALESASTGGFRRFGDLDRDFGSGEDDEE